MSSAPFLSPTKASTQTALQQALKQQTRCKVTSARPAVVTRQVRPPIMHHPGVKDHMAKERGKPSRDPAIKRRTGRQ